MMRKGFIFSICFHTTILLLLVISFHINKTVNSGIMQTEQVYLPQAFIANQVSLQSFTASTTTAALAKNGISPSVAINSTSSHNTLLDRLAIQAVQEITPILIAKKFIREMQPLKIRIIFK